MKLIMNSLSKLRRLDSNERPSVDGYEHNELFLIWNVLSNKLSTSVRF